MPANETEDEKKANQEVSVTIGGRQLEVVNAVAREMGVRSGEAIRSIIERWITSEEGAKVLLEFYRIDIRGPEAKVLRMKAENGGG